MLQEHKQEKYCKVKHWIFLSIIWRWFTAPKTSYPEDKQLAPCLSKRKKSNLHFKRFYDSNYLYQEMNSHAKSEMGYF